MHATSRIERGLLVLVGLVLGCAASLTLVAALAERLCAPAAAPAEVHLPDPPILEPRSFTVDYFGLTYQGNTRDFIDRRILREGSYELYVLHFLRDALAALARPAPAFVDVGANTGAHMLFMARHAAQVHAFEPFPPLVERLRQQVAANHLEHVHVHPEGLGAEAATLPFYVPDEANLGTGSFVTDVGAGRAQQTLRIVRGDDALPTGLDVAVVKIDVEGFEQPVLRGLRATLERCRPVVVLELNLGGALSFGSMPELVAAFPPRYRFAVLHGVGARWLGGYRVEERSLIPGASQCNVVAVPEEHAATLLLPGTDGAMTR